MLWAADAREVSAGHGYCNQYTGTAKLSHWHVGLLDLFTIVFIVETPISCVVKWFEILELSEYICDGLWRLDCYCIVNRCIFISCFSHWTRHF